MISGNILIAFVLTQYIIFGITLLNKTNKSEIMEKNERIEELRGKPALSLDEQKEFIKLKYNQEPVPFSWLKFIKNSLLNIGIFLILFSGLNYTIFRPNFWLTLLSIIIIVWIINSILRKFNLQRQDGLDVFFR